MSHSPGTGYSSVTELPSCRASAEQLQRLYCRYRFAAELSVGKEVLEVACGSGIGLGYLAGSATKVIGGDIDQSNLDIARSTYKGRGNIELLKLDAQELPFKDASFDVVVMFEAIYYLQTPARFVAEARRVLRPGGTLLICSANPEWAGFNPSPFSRNVLTARELYELALKGGFNSAKLLAASPASDETLSSRLAGLLKKLAVKLGLIPDTLKGRETLKRIFQGPLTPLPAELRDGMAPYHPPDPISHDVPVTNYKVVFLLAIR